MFLRLLACSVLATTILACGGATPPTRAPNAPVTPGGAPPPTQVQPPVVIPTAPGGGGGGGGGGQLDPAGLEARARALMPPGSTELAEMQIGGSYTLSFTSSMSLDQLTAFWAQAIPAQGMTESGRFTMEGTLTIAVTNPDGGIVASQDTSTGLVTVQVSLGIS